MTGRGLVTTPPEVRLCDRCRSIILVGISEGLRVEADTAVLPLAAQLQATLMGLQTYQLTRTGLHHIDFGRARSAHLWKVVPEHRCRVVWPPSSTTLPTSTEVDTPPY